MNQPYYSPSEIPSEPPLAPIPSGGEEEPSHVRRHFSHLGLAYLAMTVAFTAAAYAVSFAVMYAFPALYGYWWFSWAVSLLPLYGVGLPTLWFCLKRVPAAPHNTLCPRDGLPAEKPPFGLRQWLILLVMAFGCTTLGSLMGNFIMTALSEATGYDYAFALNDMVNNTPVWFTAICTCICAPFGEELLFRKLLIDRTRRYGDFTAILLSGILFGLFHSNLFQFFYAAMAGMILAYVYTRTGKYLYCVAMHASINFMGSVVSLGLSRLMAPLNDSTMSAGEAMAALANGRLMWAIGAALFLLVWQYGMLIAGIRLFCRHFRHRVLSTGKAVPPRLAALVWINPGMIACVIIMLALTAVNLIPLR